MVESVGNTGSVNAKTTFRVYVGSGSCYRKGIPTNVIQTFAIVVILIIAITSAVYKPRRISSAAYQYKRDN